MTQPIQGLPDWTKSTTEPPRSEATTSYLILSVLLCANTSCSHTVFWNCPKIPALTYEYVAAWILCKCKLLAVCIQLISDKKMNTAQKCGVEQGSDLPSSSSFVIGIVITICVNYFLLIWQKSICHYNCSPQTSSDPHSTRFLLNC